MVPGAPGSVSLGQWHPYILVEKPTFGGAATPWVEVGRDFYSKNPGIIEARAGQPQFSSAGSLNGLVGGLLYTTGVVGLNLALPAHLKATASFGLEQESSDNNGRRRRKGAGLKLDFS